MNPRLPVPNATAAPTFPSSSSLPPQVPEFFPTRTDGTSSSCHGVFYNALLVVPAVLFAVYLGINARKNVVKLWNGRSYIMISYYAILWLACSLNLGWSFLQRWQCVAGKEVGWNLLTMLTTSAMLCLEMSIVGFLLQDSYTSGLNTLSRTFVLSGVVVAVDFMFKTIYVFGFRVPMFIDSVDSDQRMKWGLWIIQKLLLTALYGHILYVHFSNWREKLPARPSFYNYVVIMFSINAAALFACGLAGIGASFGIWLSSFLAVCYHSLYLPFLYVTLLADFFQEEDFLLDNAYYSEMKDAGFFDADWE